MALPTAWNRPRSKAGKWLTFKLAQVAQNQASAWLTFWLTFINIKATGLYFLSGILLSSMFQRYVPQDLMVKVFGGNEAWGVLMAATIGVPLYACGGGTIPLLQDWLIDGMSLGSAAAFMLTGPATKITNLGALKIVLGLRRFLLYLAFIMLFSLLSGIIVNAVL